MPINFLASAIEKKYGLCADFAMHKDGTFEVSRWDAAIAGTAQPSNETLLADAQYYVENQLPDIDAALQEDARLNNADIKFKKLTLSALKDINQAQPKLFSAETKQLFTELRGLLK